MSIYKEEQLGEIFSLESIYPDELESKFHHFNLVRKLKPKSCCFISKIVVLEEEPFHQFKLHVKSEGHDEEEEIGYACTLKFTYTPTYPEEVPIVEIQDDVCMDEEQLLRLTEHLGREDSWRTEWVFQLLC